MRGLEGLSHASLSGAQQKGTPTWDANYKLHWIISRAERDTTNRLFRARVIILCPRTRQEEDRGGFL